VRSKGIDYELKAETFLKKKGLKTLIKNYSCRSGEIDLIMQDGQDIVFVEVRYRKHKTYGTAKESITHSKQRKLIITAQHYLQKQRLYDRCCRFDTVTFDADGTYDQLEWTISAFGA